MTKANSQHRPTQALRTWSCNDMLNASETSQCELSALLERVSAVRDSNSFAQPSDAVSLTRWNVRNEFFGGPAARLRYSLGDDFSIYVRAPVK